MIIEAAVTLRKTEYARREPDAQTTRIAVNTGDNTTPDIEAVMALLNAAVELAKRSAEMDLDRVLSGFRRPVEDPAVTAAAGGEQHANGMPVEERRDARQDEDRMPVITERDEPDPVTRRWHL